MRQDYYDAIAAKLGDGGRTHHIVNRLGWVKASDLIRRYLTLMEREGKVRRNVGLTSPGSIWWEPAR